MRRALHLVLIIALAFGGAACDTLSSDPLLDHITPPDDSTVPDSVKQAYQEDAAQLTVRDMQERTPGTDRVTLPEDRVELFYNALVHVYKEEGIDERSEIEDIHTFPRYNTHEIIVAVDTTVDWTEAWQNGERLTGQSEVDALLEEYELSVEYQSSSSQSYALVRSEAPINPVGLSQQFEPIEGVVYAEQNGYAGDGNDIQATVNPNAVVLVYSRGWGDCPAGCINHESWTFQVEEDGTVRFAGHDEQ